MSTATQPTVGAPETLQASNPPFAGLRWLWRVHKLGLLVLLALSALVLGLIGFLDSDESPLDAAYHTLSLLAFNYTPPPDGAPWTLQVARFLAPAASAFATFTVLTALLVEQWTLVRAGRRRGHVVICGLGQRGMQLTRSFRARGERVTVVEANRTDPRVDEARRLGALVVIGNAGDPDILRRARVGKACRLVAVCSDDATNAAVASGASTLVDDAGGHLAALCHVADPELVEELTAVALASSSRSFTLEWFSILDRAALLLVVEHGGLESAARTGETPRLVIVGDDKLARSIVRNAVRAWQAILGTGSASVEIRLVGPNARAWMDNLCARWPELSSHAELTAYEHDLEDLRHADEATDLFDDATAVFVCAPDDTESLELGFAVSRLAGVDSKIVIRLMIETEGFAQLLRQAELTSSIELFSLVERTCSAELVAGGVFEALARAIHATYVEQQARSPSTDPSRPLQDFDDLPAHFKESNRAQARDVARKLNVIGCRVRPLIYTNVEPLELSVDEVEQLAELEHERFNEERRAQGFRRGVATHRAKAIHQYLDVPWSDLPDDVKDIDRAFVARLPRNLAKVGYELYRLR